MAVMGGNDMSIQKDTEIFCRNVYWRLEEAGITVKELSKRSGVPMEMLEALEQGAIPEEMMVDDAFNLAKVFGCKVYELFQS